MVILLSLFKKCWTLHRGVLLNLFLLGMIHSSYANDVSAPTSIPPNIEPSSKPVLIGAQAGGDWSANASDYTRAYLTFGSYFIYDGPKLPGDGVYAFDDIPGSFTTITGEISFRTDITSNSLAFGLGRLAYIASNLHPEQYSATLETLSNAITYATNHIPTTYAPEQTNLSTAYQLTNSAYMWLSLESYSLYKLKYYWKVNTDTNQVVMWDENFIPADGGTNSHKIITWKNTGGSSNTPYYYIDPLHYKDADGTVQSKYGTWNVQLLPVDIAVDANRDGTIVMDTDPKNPANVDANGNQLPVDTTTQDRPYRFWLNNDNDSGEQDHPGSSTKDSDSSTIVSQRDLEDFSRLWLHFGGLQDAIIAGTIQVGLEWRNVTGSPAIKIFQAAEPNGGDQYLKTAVWAGNQQSGSFGTALGTIDGSGGFKLPTSFWQSNLMGLSALSATQPNRYLLFEGVSNGKGQLVLTFWQNGQKIGEGGSVWIDLHDIKEMYRRVKVTGIAENSPEPSQTTISQPSDPAMGWTEDSNGYAFDDSPTSWQETKQYIVFVHGWNMSYNASENFGETMYKRLWQHGFKGRYALMRWPTLDDSFVGVPYTFNASEYRAWKSGESLKQFMSSLPGGYAKDLISHSMGGIVCGSALQKGMGVANYALCHAAVSAFCYDDRTDSNGKSVLDENWGYTTACYDSDQGTRNLSYRYKLNTVSANLINFFLPADAALKKWELNNYTSGLGSLGAKPQRYNLGSTGYYYNPNAASGAKLAINYQTTIGRFVTTAHEAMAYVVQSPTKAVGAKGDTGGSIAAKVDLSDPDYAFGTEHSAEFNFTTQATTDFYNNLLDELGIPRIQ